MATFFSTAINFESLVEAACYFQPLQEFLLFFEWMVRKHIREESKRVIWACSAPTQRRKDEAPNFCCKFTREEDVALGFYAANSHYVDHLKNPISLSFPTWWTNILRIHIFSFFLFLYISMDVQTSLRISQQILWDNCLTLRTFDCQETHRTHSSKNPMLFSHIAMPLH